MELLGVKATALLIGIAENTLRYWRSTGYGPPSFKVGRKIVYRRHEVEEWMAQQEAATRCAGKVRAV